VAHSAMFGVVAALAAACLAACASGNTHPTTTPVASPTVSASSPPAATVAPTSDGSAICSTSHLRITRQMVSSGSFTTWWIYFIQTNGAACQLSGTPTLQLRATEGVVKIRNSPLSTNPDEGTITISPGTYASFYTIEDCGNPDAPPTTFGTIEVALRSVSTLLVSSVAGPSQSCTVDAGVSAVQTGTVQPQGLAQRPSITPIPWH